MKLLSRDFTLREKILLLLLSIFLLGLLYYHFVDEPVRADLATAASEKAALEIELGAVEQKVAQLERMKKEIDDQADNSFVSFMPSYNNSGAVNLLLNDVLGDLGYYITFSNVTRSGNQIRRSISLQFSAPDYRTVESVLSRLTSAQFRCLIEDVACTTVNTRSARGDDRASVNVNATVTFYETMVGGTADAGLPEEKAVEK